MTLSAFEPVRTSRPHPHQALDRGASCALSIERRRVDLIYHSVECRTVWQVESLITFGFEPLPDLILGTLPPLPMLVTSAAQYNPTPDALDESLKARVAMLTASREARGRDRCIEKWGSTEPQFGCEGTLRRMCCVRTISAVNRASLDCGTARVTRSYG